MSVTSQRVRRVVTGQTSRLHDFRFDRHCSRANRVKHYPIAKFCSTSETRRRRKDWSHPELGPNPSRSRMQCQGIAATCPTGCNPRGPRRPRGFGHAMANEDCAASAVIHTRIIDWIEFANDVATGRLIRSLDWKMRVPRSLRNTLRSSRDVRSITFLHGNTHSEPRGSRK